MHVGWLVGTTGLALVIFREDTCILHVRNRDTRLVEGGCRAFHHVLLGGAHLADVRTGALLHHGLELLDFTVTFFDLTAVARNLLLVVLGARFLITLEHGSAQLSLLNLSCRH